MDGQTGKIIFYIIIGFLSTLFLAATITMLILWRRRKYIFTKFLTDTGQWEGESWMPNKIGKQFVYDNETYDYCIVDCTRDALNRPIAHYYKGNPKQQKFNFALNNKKIDIGTGEMTMKDFNVLMLSKVLRDIFQDEEVMNMLMLILIAIGVSVLINVILIVTHNPPVKLKNDNTTLQLITDACRNAITGGVRTPIAR
jgi:hypothetical protein